MLGIGGEFITPTSAARNLVVVFYSLLNMEEHFSSIMLKCILDTPLNKLEKGFQKKTIVAFTNSTVFILDFNI